MAELTTMGNIIRSEQDTDVTMEFGRMLLSRAARSTSDTMRWQVPPQLIAQAFFGIDVTVNRFLANSHWGVFMDHSIANLFWRPTILEAFNDALTQFWISDQLTISRTTVCTHSMRRITVIAIAFWHALIAEEIPLQFSENR
jgi:hypothetical protein